MLLCLSLFFLSLAGCERVCSLTLKWSRRCCLFSSHARSLLCNNSEIDAHDACPLPGYNQICRVYYGQSAFQPSVYNARKPAVLFVQIHTGRQWADERFICNQTFLNTHARARCAYVCMFFRHVYAQNATLCAVVLSKYPRGHMFLLHLAVSCEHTWKRHAAAIPETHRHARHHHSRALRSSDGMAIFRHSASFCNVCVYNVAAYFKMTNDFGLEQTSCC